MYLSSVANEFEERFKNEWPFGRIKLLVIRYICVIPTGPPAGKYYTEYTVFILQG